MTATAFKSADAASYDNVGAGFDRLSERFSAPLADELVQRAGLAQGERVLDVGTGTGLVARRALRTLGSSGTVLGVDLSEGMLATAQAQAHASGLGERLGFRRMDAEALELPEGSHDVVLSLFALLHFPDPARALGEMRRVLRPGGRLAIGVGSPPPLFSAAALGRAAGRVAEGWRVWRGLEAVAPLALDRLVAARLPEGAWGDVTELERHGALKPARVPALVRAAGFKRLRVSWVGHCAVIESPEEFWELQCTYSTRARKRLAQAQAEQARALREELLSGARQVQARGGRLVYRSAALYVTAERPAVSSV